MPSEINRSQLISPQAWGALTPKQQSVVLFMVEHLGEDLGVRQIRDGVGLRSLSGLDLSSIKHKLANHEAGAGINIKEEADRVFYRMVETHQ